MKKITIQEIAHEAKVSVATVSRALNNQELVKASTYTRILAAAKKLEYSNNPFDELDTQSVNSSTSKFILVLIPGFDNPFYSKIIRGICTSAMRQNYQCLMYSVDQLAYTYETLKDLIVTTKSAGVIFLAPVSDDALLKQLCELVPIVQCTEYNERSDVSYVSIDDLMASRTLMEYLISKGRRQIALINGPSTFKYSRQRLAGYCSALTAANIEINQDLIVHLPDVNYDLALSVATQLLNREQRPDAIFAVSDVFAGAAVRAARRASLRIPEDLAVAGFDNTSIAMMCDPPLTTVSQPQFQMGCLACDVLVDQIKEPGLATRHLLLQTELVIREST